MRILLLNNNPVVNKLVTLSAQKTSNTLDVAESVGAVESKNYDILIVDDALYSEDAMNELKDKIEYGKSLYICSKDAKPASEFTKILKKPFLPTDLVELFITLAKETNTINLEKLGTSNFEEFDTSLDEELESLDESAEVEDLEDLEGFDDSESLDEDLEIKQSDKDNYESEEDDMDFENLDESLDDDIGFDEDGDFDNLESTQDKSDSVLDKDELKEVKSLLEESDMEEFDSEEFDLADLADMQSSQAKDNILEVEDDTDDDMFEDLELEGDDLELDDDDEMGFEELTTETPTNKSADKESEDELKFEDDLELEDNFGFDDKLEVEDDLKSEDDLEFEDDKTEDTEEDFALEDDETQKLDDEESFEDLNSDVFEDALEEDNLEEENSKEAAHDEESDDLEDLESQIESAVKELSDEDLQSEVDEDMLMDIDSLTSRDLKIAIGEEVSADEEFSEADAQAGFDDSIEKSETEVEVSEIPKEINASSNDGVEALKKLLKALSNEEVVASLKGMKININITLGDSSES